MACGRFRCRFRPFEPFLGGEGGWPQRSVRSGGVFFIWGGKTRIGGGFQWFRGVRGLGLIVQGGGMLYVLLVIDIGNFDIMRSLRYNRVRVGGMLAVGDDS